MTAVSLGDALIDFFASPAGGSLGTVQVDIFAERMPTEPSACLAVRTLRGRAPLTVFGASQAAPVARYPRVSVIVRDPSPEAAWVKMRTAWSKLCNLAGYTSGPFSVLYVRPDGEPEARGENALGNTVIEATFSVTMREA